jgi:hypothetical protein
MITQEEALEAAHCAIKDHITHLTTMFIQNYSGDQTADSYSREYANMRHGLNIAKKIDVSTNDLICSVFPITAISSK